MARDRRPESTVSVDEIADELYSLPPSDFTARRDEFVRTAKAAGDSDAAKAVRALRKPSTAAWLVNQLVRTHRDDVAALLGLGGALRQAQSRLEGSQLRELSRQRRQAVNALVHQARQLAVEFDRPVGDDVGREVERTLEAALASTDSADQVETGRLTTALSPSGGFDSARPHLQVVPEVKPKKQDQAGRRSAAAKAQLAAATASAKEAEAELEQRSAEHEQLRAGVEDLTGRVAELSHELEELEEKLAAAKRQEQTARKAVTTAERAAHRAQLAVEAARAEVDQ